MTLFRLTLGTAALLATGCGSASAGSGAAQPTPSARPVAAPSPSPDPGSSPSPVAGLVIGLADAGRTIAVSQGAEIVVRLADASAPGYLWSDPVSSNAAVLRRPLPGPRLQADDSFPFLAVARGSAMITATGDLPCRQSRPPCEVPSRLFRVTIEVA